MHEQCTARKRHIQLLTSLTFKVEQTGHYIYYICMSTVWNGYERFSTFNIHRHQSINTQAPIILSTWNALDMLLQVQYGSNFVCFNPLCGTLNANTSNPYAKTVCTSTYLPVNTFYIYLLSKLLWNWWNGKFILFIMLESNILVIPNQSHQSLGWTQKISKPNRYG